MQSRAIRFLFVIGLGGLSVTLATSQEETSLGDLLPRIPPRAPQEVLESFQIEEGFRLELVASEPQIADPVAIAFDENGRIYVAEMRDYPHPPEDGKTPYGRVRLLEDTDEDGFYETSHLFVDPLPWPTGVACWKGGVFVASAPNLFYFKDTTGDGVADRKEIVYSGFGTAHVYATLNNLKWGLDNYFYGTSSYNGGHIQPETPVQAESTSVGGRDFRFDPRDWRFEAVSGTSEFGNSFDDWGDRFVCNAGTLILHPVLPDQYLARNPYLPVGGVMEHPFGGGGRKKVFPIHTPEPWRVVRRNQWDRWVDSNHDMRAGRFPDEELAPSGYVTAAAGVTIYRGGAYPEKYRGAAFTGETAQNVVVCMGLSPNGVGFAAERLTGEKEFIASTDNWFRPVNFENGPDGCLYLVDMYREIIEDPSAIPEDIQEFLDMTSGRDHGRIYRIVPDGFKRPAPPRLGSADTRRLVSELSSPDSWPRDTAQRLLVERQDLDAVGPLEEMARMGKTPQSRLHALYTLDGLGALEPATIALALDDPDAAVRGHGLRFAEARFDDDPALAEKALGLRKDSSPRVRFQLAFSLGYSEDPRAVEALAEIAVADGEKEWFEPAILSSLSQRPVEFIDFLLRTTSEDGSTHDSVVQSFSRKVASLVGAKKDPAEVAQFLTLLSDRADPSTEAWTLSCLTGLTGSLGNGEAMSLSNKEGLSALKGLMENSSMEVAASATRLAVILRVTDSPEVQKAIDTLVANAIDESKSTEERTTAIVSLGELRLTSVVSDLAGLLALNQAPEIQTSVVQAFAKLDDPRVGVLLLERWSEYTPGLRAEVSEALFAHKSHLPALLDGLENGKVEPGSLSALERYRLLNDTDPAVAQRAASVLDNRNTDEEAKWRESSSILAMQGNVEKGKTVFENHCAKCHLVRGIGKQVGPDLSSLTNKPDETLLKDILFPSATIVPGYANYFVETTDGRTLTGVLATETATSVTLREAEKKETTLLRGEIETLRALALSAMPQDQEKIMSRQDLADLLAFLRDTIGPVQSSVVTLFDDDPGLLDRLDQGAGRATLDADEPFSGTASLAVHPPQRYSPRIPGWSYRIAENPGAGEYRFLQLAWKTRGGEGIMIELADNGGWPPAEQPLRRYYSGINATEWEATEVDPDPPHGWTVITRDLYKDFGAFTLTGIAPTAMGGTGLFDRIRLARTLEELVESD